MNFKSYVLISIVLILSSCTSESKKLIFKKQNSKNIDENYLNTSNQFLEGQVKAIKLNENIYLAYRLVYTYDTSANLKVDKALFLGEPSDIGHYSNDIDTIFLQVKDERKRMIVSLKEADKVKTEGRKNDPFLSLDRVLMIVDSDYTTSLTEKIYTEIQKAKQQETYPIYYSGTPHYKTRSPRFQVQYKLRFLDKDDFEIISFSTDEFPVSPFQDNIIEGKIDVGYKNLNDFKNEVFDKTKKVFITLESAHL